MGAEHRLACRLAFPCLATSRREIVRRFRAGSFCRHPAESIDRIPTETALIVVSARAVEQLLFGQQLQLAVGNLCQALQSTRRSERPAAFTMSFCVLQQRQTSGLDDGQSVTPCK